MQLDIIGRLASRASLCAALFLAWQRQALQVPTDVHELTVGAGLSAADEQGAHEIFDELQRLGCISAANKRWIPTVEFYKSLAPLIISFSAIDHFAQTVHKDETRAQVVLTKPVNSSDLERQLDKSGWRVAAVEATDRAFLNLVRRAKKRVVIMTPFLDKSGAEWLQQIICQVRPSVTKNLILRSLEDATRVDFPLGYNVIREWLETNEVSVYNYSIPREQGRRRETFHAKVILVDRDTAYVGSSNLTAASRDYSMEMGVVLHGKAAFEISEVVDAVLRTASRV
jgi:phosphatidylserine/phosphatidylglycerophosphate/cardiolipin synthase-like enzyme